jgi:hypothetical protein
MLSPRAQHATGGWSKAGIQTPVRIPEHPITRSDDIRSPIPAYPVTLAAAAERGPVMSIVLRLVKRGAGRPRHQWGVPRAARRAVSGADAAARAGGTC